MTENNSIGFALSAISFVKLYLSGRILQNDSLFKKARLLQTDERNIALASGSKFLFGPDPDRKVTRISELRAAARFLRQAAVGIRQRGV